MDNVHFINQDLKSMSAESLNLLKENIEKELQARNNQRRDELIQQVCDAMNELYHKFPGTELNVNWECDCGYNDSCDVFYYFCSGRKMTKDDFTCY